MLTKTPREISRPGPTKDKGLASGSNMQRASKTPRGIIRQRTGVIGRRATVMAITKQTIAK